MNKTHVHRYRPQNGGDRGYWDGERAEYVKGSTLGRGMETSHRVQST